MENWPADQVERRSIEALIPYARNSRVHSEEQVAQIAASMKEWGWTNPVLIDEDGGIIAGHGRVMAARKLGYDEVPCMVASGWTDAQKKAYVIADNRLAEMANWDMNQLMDEAQSLMDEGFNIDLVGIDQMLVDAASHDFSPILEPKTSKGEVTDDQIQKKQSEIDGKFEKMAEQSFVDVICPECGCEFKVSGK